MPRVYRWIARPAVLTVCLVSILVGVTGSPAQREVIVILQMNLCSSGYAGCYTGRSVQQANVLIKTHSPDVVTVNEACRDDIAALEASVAEISAGWSVVSAFQPVPARPTGRAVHCRNGQEFGVGLVARYPRPTQTVASGGIYPVQDGRDPEQRVWLCLHALGRFASCTTHLAIDISTAFAQCGHLLGTAVPSLRASATVVSGDFNLPYSGVSSLRSCLPPGYGSRTDGGLQHLAITPGFTVLESARVDMAGTTDHPALLASVTSNVTIDNGHSPTGPVQR